MRTLFKALTTLIASLAASAALAAYPERPITLIVPWGAGGGTDAVARIIATLMEKDLGQPVNVVNRTGGSGVVGHQAISAAAPDGYTIGMITVEIGMMHHQGLTELKRPVVHADRAGQRRPGRHPGARRCAVQERRANCSRRSRPTRQVQGLGHRPGRHLAPGDRRPAAATRRSTRRRCPGCRRNGAAPGLKDLVAGGVEVVPCSLPEARALIDAGKVKSLAVMDPQPRRRCSRRCRR